MIAIRGARGIAGAPLNPAPSPTDGWMPPARALTRESRLARVAAGTMHDLNNRLGAALLAASSLEPRRAALERALADGSLRRDDLATFLTRHRDGQTLVGDSLRLAATQANALRELILDQVSGRPRAFELRQYLAGALHGLVLARKPDATSVRVTGDQITLEDRPASWASAAEEAADVVLPPRGGGVTVALRHREGAVELDFVPDPPNATELELAAPAQNLLASLRAFVTHSLAGTVDFLPAGLRIRAPAPNALVVPALAPHEA